MTSFQHQLSIKARDFVLFRRDSPNLISSSSSSPWRRYQNQSATTSDNSWIADYFLVASPSPATSEPITGSNSNDKNNDIVAPSIVIHICPITGQFIHKNKVGVDVFSSRSEAFQVLEKTFGCVRVSGANGFYELCSMYDSLIVSHQHQQQRQSGAAGAGAGANFSVAGPTATTASSAAAQQQQQLKQEKIQEQLLARGAEFGFLLGACFVKNVPVAAASASNSSLNNNIDNNRMTGNINNLKSSASEASSSSASTYSNQQHLQQGSSNISNYNYSLQQTNVVGGEGGNIRNNNDNNMAMPTRNINNSSTTSALGRGGGGSSSVPMLEMYLIVADEFENKAESCGDEDNNNNNNTNNKVDFSIMAPDLCRLSNVRAIKISSNLVGVLCDPQLDYTAPATVHALNAREMNSAYPTTSELLTTIQSYSSNFCYHFHKKKSEPSFFSAVDFLQLDKDEEKHKNLCARAKATNTSLQALLSTSDISKTFVEATRAQIVPWNFGLAVPLHRAEKQQQSLSWLCVKVSLVFEFVNDLPPPPAPPSVTTATLTSSKPATEIEIDPVVSRIVAIPTFMYLKNSFFSLLRWSQFSCGIEVASYCFGSSATRERPKRRDQSANEGRSEGNHHDKQAKAGESKSSNHQQQQQGDDPHRSHFQQHQQQHFQNRFFYPSLHPELPPRPIDEFFSATWVCSRPASSLSLMTAAAASSSSNHLGQTSSVGARRLPTAGASSIDDTLNSAPQPSTPLEFAAAHLPETERRQLFASIESEMKSRIQGRWSSLGREAATLTEQKEASDAKGTRKTDSTITKATSTIKNKKRNLLLYSSDPLNDFAGDLFVTAECSDEHHHCHRSLQPLLFSSGFKTLAPGSLISSKLSWSDCLLSYLLPGKAGSSSSSNNISRNLQLRTLIIDFCSSVCKVRSSVALIVGVSDVRALSDPPVVSIRINKNVVPSSSFGSNNSLIADMLPNSVLRGMWYSNRVLRHSVCVTFAVPYGTKIAGVGFLRPVFPRPPMVSSSSASSANHASSFMGQQSYLPPLRSAPFSPYPITNRAELKYRAPFPSSAWSVSVGVSTLPHDENPTLLVHDVPLPLVLYSETRPVVANTTNQSPAHFKNAEHSTTSSSYVANKNLPEHALCVIRVPELSSVESRGFLTVPNDDVASQQHSSKAVAGAGGAAGGGRARSGTVTGGRPSTPATNNTAATTTTTTMAAADDWAIAHGLKDVVSTMATPRCSFVSVVLRGSLNAEVPFGAHQIVLFGEIPEPCADVCVLDHQTGLKMVDPISTGKALLSLPERNSTGSGKVRDSLLTFGTPRSLHEAFAAEERRLALQVPASVWNSYNTIKNGNQCGKLNLNSHVCEFSISPDIAKLITIAGGNALAGIQVTSPSLILSSTPSSASGIPTNIGNRLVASTVCCARGCGKGGFFNRLTACDNCGRNFCGGHWRKLKDSRILERCSNVGVFCICNSCETLMNLLESALAELEPKAMAAGSTAISSIISSEHGGSDDQLARVKRQQQLTVFQQQRSQMLSAPSPSSTKGNELFVLSQQHVASSSSGGFTFAPNSMPKPTLSTTVKDVFCFFGRWHSSSSWTPVAKFDDLCSSQRTRLIVDFVLPVDHYSSAMASEAKTAGPLALGLLVHTNVRAGIIRVSSANLFVPTSYATSVTTNYHQQNYSNNNSTGESIASSLNWIALTPSRSFATMKLDKTDEPAASTSSLSQMSSGGAGSSNCGVLADSPGASTAAAATKVPSYYSPSLFLQGRYALLRLNLDVVDASVFRRYINCIFVRDLTSLAGGDCAAAVAGYDDDDNSGCASSGEVATSPIVIVNPASTSSLQVSRPPRRKAIGSIYDDDDDNADDDAGDGEDHNHRTEHNKPFPSPRRSKDTNSSNNRTALSTSNSLEEGSVSSLAAANSSSVSSSASSPRQHHPKTAPFLFSPPPLQHVQYSKDFAAEMSVRNMIVCPNGSKTNCRTWIRPPISSAAQQPGGQQVSSTSTSPTTTHGVWGAAAGIMLRLPFGVSPNLHRSAPAHQHPSFPVNATAIHSFRVYAIERDITCRAHHAATLAVPLVYLVSRSHNMNNAVEVFLPFGKSVKEENAAGFVLDVETVEKRDPSTGGKNVAMWERDWAALADSASPFFVREGNSGSSSSSNNENSRNNNNNNSTTIGGGLSKVTLSAIVAAKQRGSAIASVNSGDLVKNTMF